jgi:hypothetical protein
VGAFLDRELVDELLSFDASLGIDSHAYAGVWRDDCTLMLVAGNTSAALPPVTGVWALRVRDDIHEVRVRRRRVLPCAC